MSASMNRLPYLVREVASAVEIYLAGRIGQQFNRTSFILADDCAELASKLFLLTDNPQWSDEKGNGRYKRFKEVTSEIRGHFNANRPTDVSRATMLLAQIEARRERRNGFFHSAKLLDLTLYQRDCVEALCDLLDYCLLLFPPVPGRLDEGWAAHAAVESDFETFEAILRVDRRAYVDGRVAERLNDILRKLPRNGGRVDAKGCEVTRFPADFYLRLAVRNGGKELRDKVRGLL